MSPFPVLPSPHLKVVVAARGAGSTWLRKLNWSKTLAESRDLPPLPRSAVDQILINLGAPLDLLRNTPQFADKLFELSEGDPLVLRLYIEDMLKEGENACNLTAADLENRKPGLEGFFDGWLDDQERIWQTRDPLERAEVWAIIRLCALARGRLCLDDFAALCPDILSEGRQVRSAAGYLERFLDGDVNGEGVVVIHPRLAEYFRN